MRTPLFSRIHKEPMPAHKSYRAVPIRECGEPMVSLPRELFAFYDPHPYVALGAPYGAETPWLLRESIAASLVKAQRNLQNRKPGWKILMFDAYRPNAVQAFMVARELELVAREEGLSVASLSESERERLMGRVFRVWGIPSEDPATPPPHSTGAVFDCTLADETGREVDMGSPLDENSDRSLPDYFANASDEAGQQAHHNRTLLNEILAAEGFCRHFSEWWHFSRGDQVAVWSEREKAPQAVAIYGRVDLASIRATG